MQREQTEDVASEIGGDFAGNQQLVQQVLGVWGEGGQVPIC